MFRFAVVDRIDRKLIDIFDDLESAKKLIDKINNKNSVTKKMKRIITVKIRGKNER